MGTEFKQFPIIIPQIFTFYQPQHLVLYGCILKRAAGSFGIHEDILGFTILIVSTIDGFLDQSCQFCTDRLFECSCFYLINPDNIQPVSL